MPLAETRWFKRIAEFVPKEDVRLLPACASVFEVWDNISNDEVAELEGLFRHIYRRDSKANRLNRQRKYRPFQRIRKNDLSSWK